MNDSFFFRTAAKGKALNWAGLYLATMFLATCVSGLRVLGSSGMWTLADWLINYTGGFVRRGLPGTVFLFLHQILHVKLPVLVVCFVIALYACLFACIYRLVMGVRWNFWFIAAFLSPVTVASAFVSTSGYHKEVLFFAAFAVLLVRLLRLRKRQQSIGWVEGAYLGSVGVLGVLTHELFAIYLPYMLVALYIVSPDWKRVSRNIALPLLVTGMALAAVVTHPGTPQLAHTVCDSLGPANQAMCAGSIDYLGHTRKEARADTFGSALEYHYGAFLPPLTLLGLWPLVNGFWVLKNELTRRTRFLLLFAAIASLLLSLVLFVYGADWGRWIEIHLFNLFLLLLFVNSLHEESSTVQVGSSLKTWQMVVLLVYASCWSLPGTTSVPKGGYVSMFTRVGSRVFYRQAPLR